MSCVFGVEGRAGENGRWAIKKILDEILDQPGSVVAGVRELNGLDCLSFHPRAQSLFFSSMAMALSLLGHGGDDHSRPRQVRQAGERISMMIPGLWMVG